MANLTLSLDTRAMTTFKRIMDVDANFYPERLKYMILINVPWHFSALWAVIRPLLDPVTRDKFVLLGSNYAEQLQHYIGADSIPVEFGGELKVAWSWPYPESSLCTPEHIESYNAHRDREEGLSARPRVLSLPQEGGGVGDPSGPPPAQMEMDKDVSVHGSPWRGPPTCRRSCPQKSFVDSVERELSHNSKASEQKLAMPVMRRIILLCVMVLLLVGTVVFLNALVSLHRDASGAFHGVISMEQLLLWVWLGSMAWAMVALYVVFRLFHRFVSDAICC
jgi:hypothetical protein